MGEFFKVLRRFVPPYKKCLALNIIFNILAAFLTLFSFAVIMLFEIREKGYHYMPMSDVSVGALADVIVNNFYYITQLAIESWGASWTLAVLGLLLIVMTGLKTGATFLASYFIIPLRSGIVRDIRNAVYDKIVSLPIGFFTSERKGDVMARMSGDVAEIENSIMSSLDCNDCGVSAYDGFYKLAAYNLCARAVAYSRHGNGAHRQKPETQKPCRSAAVG